MTFTERMKNIFTSNQLPRGFVHNPEYDMVLLYETFGRLPAIVDAKNGRRYIYFEDASREDLSIVRKMGFKPHRHKSKRYNPAKVIYRAPISILMELSAWVVVNKMQMTTKINKYNFPHGVEITTSSESYRQYIENYKNKSK